MFTGKDVMVIGGGNAGFETAAQLLAYVKSVTLINYDEKFRAEAITIQKVLKHPNITTLNNIETIANVPIIINRGWEWFSRIGAPKQPGTLLYGISGHVNKPGVYELPTGVSTEIRRRPSSD